MRSLRAIVLVGTALTLVLIIAPTASASIEVGDECAGNEASGAFTLVPETHASGGALPLAAPSSGVVTAWKVNSTHSSPVSESMGDFRPLEVGKFQLIGESNEETVNPGTNVFPARIPVQAGDRLGLLPVGEESPLFCLTSDSGDRTWSLPGSVGLGAPHLFAAGVEVRVPLVSVIEPDRDGDGYGDETQDKCPQSAAYQGECPRVVLDLFPIVGKQLVTLLVTSNLPTSVSVSEAARRLGVPIRAGIYPHRYAAEKSVVPGEITRFKFHFYKQLRSQLKSLSPRQSMTLRFLVSAPNLVGSRTTETVRLKVRGQAKSPHKR